MKDMKDKKLEERVLVNNIVERKADVLPSQAIGSVSSIQDTKGNAYIYHQEPDGRSQVFVPAGQALNNTPIAATFNGVGTGQANGIHMFFLSPGLIVTEYLWTGAEVIGGSACPQCITTNGFLAATSQFLYAENNPTGSPAQLRVGFNSAGSPGGLTEAAQVNGVWQLAVLN
ncbi:hypothetical protein C8J56DRAFT_903875 [Mycena floridula]|nr:hypothetical protein C8J56DRAFT_903875 [Mycena floridula]